MVQRKPRKHSPPKKSIQDQEANEKRIQEFIAGKKAGTRERQFTITMSPKLLAAIDQRAEELGISRAAFIKMTCATALENH